MYKLENVNEITLRSKMQQMIVFLSHAWEKIGEALQYPLTWISSFFIFILEAFTGGKVICYIVIIASVIDLICGIAVALRGGRFTQSELLRQTLEKLVVYGAALLIFLCIDKVIQTEAGFTVDITAGIVGVLITLTETWSFLASLLILFPKNPFLKLLQKALTGELARKLNCEEEDVKEILDISRKK